MGCATGTGGGGGPGTLSAGRLGVEAGIDGVKGCYLFWISGRPPGADHIDALEDVPDEAWVHTDAVKFTIMNVKQVPGRPQRIGAVRPVGGKDKAVYSMAAPAVTMRAKAENGGSQPEEQLYFDARGAQGGGVRILPRRKSGRCKVGRKKLSRGSRTPDGRRQRSGRSQGWGFLLRWQRD